ncbi:MAG: cation:proton antiporter [Gammaproteobacteria bacterium]|nr:cation:proton antiporter [Gammaproteobacteria bacterium]
MRRFLHISSWLLAIGLFLFFNNVNPLAQHIDSFTCIIFWLSSFYGLSIVGQYLATKCHQPAVLGELMMGIIFGNICYYFQMPMMMILREGSELINIFPELLQHHSLIDALKLHIHDLKDAMAIREALQSPSGPDFMKLSYALDVFSHYGIMYLLFMVGLETSVEELKETGKSAIVVATTGVIFPILLGLLVMGIFFQKNSFYANLFIAATLSATSVGITARVLKDLRKMRTQEAKIILGAAMIDDVLGLFILAVVTSLVVQGHLSLVSLAQIFINTGLFFAVSLTLGPQLIRMMVPFSRFLKLWESKLLIGSLFIMFLAWIASLLDLSTIIGAFMAGLILNDELFYKHHGFELSPVKIKHLIRPIQFLLTPLFFFTMGLQVKLETFFHWDVLELAFILTVVAIIGKLASGALVSSQLNRWFIGMGMVPRGEVGLIFASLGRSLQVMDDRLFSSIVVMVVFTTIISPPCLKWSMNRKRLANVAE